MLGERSVEFGEVVDARKSRIDGEQAWALLKAATNITVAKGKKVVALSPGRDGKEAVLAAVMGPSGNLRAPTLRVGDAFVVGFEAELYQRLWGE